MNALSNEYNSPEGFVTVIWVEPAARLGMTARRVFAFTKVVVAESPLVVTAVVC